jgi:catalase
MPVFFIQDALKFPDLVHAVKPEPHHEMPQAAAAHDTFWDFISLMPESMHMIMWVMSDRAIPRSYRMMEGFGVHTFRLINDKGQARFVKFHWKPLLGLHSVVWDEAQKISGKDPDFHRRDLWEAIENGAYPEWEFGIQVVEEKDELKFGFDLLDPTKLIPEELVPVQRIGKMTLNRNPDNFFSETEQVAFHPGHLVSGIDFSNDPLLQGRLFSYTDTQLIRLGGPNFHEIPINRPIAPVHNNQRDGHMRQAINDGRTSYQPNSLGGGCPMQAKADLGGFVSYAEKMGGTKVRQRSRSFFDHFSQASLFWHSQSEPEQAHIVKAFRFELGKLEVPAIQERMIGMLAHVDPSLAKRVAQGLGLSVPTKPPALLNESVPADGNPIEYQPKPNKGSAGRSPALSMANSMKGGIKTRKVAILAGDGVDDADLNGVKKALIEAGAQVKIVAPRLGMLTGAKGTEIHIDFSFLTSSSVLFDAVYIPGGDKSVQALQQEDDAIEFVKEAYKHCKTIAATGAGCRFVRTACLGRDPAGGSEQEGDQDTEDAGLIIGKENDPRGVASKFINAMARHRHWARELKSQPA